MFECESVVPPKYRSRVGHLNIEFSNKFPGHCAKWVARAPGRVNLIGEHIDYCGYGVLPMAIEYDLMMLACDNDEDLILLENTNERFSPYRFNPNTFDITRQEFSWAKYFMCGCMAVKEMFPSVKLKAINVLVDGQVPIGSGLSSSSALVVCSALIIAVANNLKAEKHRLASTCAKMERYVGTEGGGMDQAISCLAKEGKADYIQFNPLRLTDVLLPRNAAFVVANSVSSCEKALTSQYNTRVVECRIGVKMLIKAFGIKDASNILIPSELEQETGLTKSKLECEVQKYIKEGPYTRKECTEVLGMSDDEFDNKILTANTKKVNEFFPRKRLLHVFGEAARVEDFARVCNEHETADRAVESLGSLMNQSHDSCDQLYDCSSPGLNELVQVMRSCGAAGARLTGAGWGGCAVALIEASKAEEFVRQVEQKYYGNKESDQVIFVSKPSEGAGIFVL